MLEELCSHGKIEMEIEKKIYIRLLYSTRYKKLSDCFWMHSFSVPSTLTLFARMGLDSESFNESGNPLQMSGCAFWSHFYNVLTYSNCRSINAALKYQCKKNYNNFSIRRTSMAGKKYGGVHISASFIHGIISTLVLKWNLKKDFRRNLPDKITYLNVLKYKWELHYISKAANFE